MPRRDSASAEVSVIGSIILSNEMFDPVVATGLRADHFKKPSYRMYYQAICEMMVADTKIELLTLYDWLQSQGVEFDTTELSELVDSVPAAATAVRYAEIVKKAAEEREFIRLVENASAQIEMGEPIMGVRDTLSMALQSTEVVDSNDSGSLRDLLSRNVGLEKCSRVPFGWSQLDRYTGGIPLGALTVIGGYSGHGKTSYATSILRHNAGLGTPVMLFSCEMSSAQIIQTMLARESGVPAMKIQSSGYLGLAKETQKQVGDAMLSISNMPYYIHSGKDSALEISAIAKTYQRQYGIQIIAVDYLQLLACSGNDESRRLSIDESLDILKELSRQSGMGVILLTQLKRPPNAGHEPSSDDFKESGGICNKPDMALIVYRPHYKDTEPCDICGGVPGMCRNCDGLGRVSIDNKAITKVEKDKFGRAGMVFPHSWIGDRMMFSTWRGD